MPSSDENIKRKRPINVFVNFKPFWASLPQNSAINVTAFLNYPQATRMQFSNKIFPESGFEVLAVIQSVTDFHWQRQKLSWSLFHRSESGEETVTHAAPSTSTSYLDRESLQLLNSVIKTPLKWTCSSIVVLKSRKTHITPPNSHLLKMGQSKSKKKCRSIRKVVKTTQVKQAPILKYLLPLGRHEVISKVGKKQFTHLTSTIATTNCGFTPLDTPVEIPKCRIIPQKKKQQPIGRNDMKIKSGSEALVQELPNKSMVIMIIQKRILRTMKRCTINHKI
ncbi:hypothetical protein EGR_05366 [Echinococcus granulosus]|uniref:Uncharacterized protein n=1 Tax=Echinococcus granulosus TaxID=6210 RepID=W6UFQ1_ECHGR|nr:hypothetical protein EGR_05366 [Echinococcus granulosus]EUB59746.1 hypothetical protein EGR_05366 [Echinococcus granulosus]